MAVALEDLLAAPTADEQTDTLIEEAAEAGFPATSWQSGSVPRTLLEVEGTTLSGLSESIRDIAAGGYLDRASGGWLTLLAKGFFDEDRVAAVLTQGLATLTAVSGAGPYTIVARSLWVSDANGRRFTNATAGTLSAGGTLELTWEAEEAGSDYNLANSTLTVMVTPLAGVSINNPDPGTGTWITQSGADEESDDQLRERCRSKWAVLGSGSTADAYEYWAAQASDEVRRVEVIENSNAGVTADGHVDVIIAGESGAVSGAAVAAVNTYIQARRTLCSTVHVASAVVESIVITGTAYVLAGFASTAEAAAQENLAAFAEELDVGATVYTAAIIEQLMEPAGMVNVVLTTPASDTSLAYNEVAQFDMSGLTYVEV